MKNWSYCIRWRCVRVLRARDLEARPLSLINQGRKFARALRSYWLLATRTIENCAQYFRSKGNFFLSTRQSLWSTEKCTQDSELLFIQEWAIAVLWLQFYGNKSAIHSRILRCSNAIRKRFCQDKAATEIVPRAFVLFQSSVFTKYQRL